MLYEKCYRCPRFQWDNGWCDTDIHCDREVELIMGKYAWHNLVKNSYDLPDEDGRYRCCVKDGDDRHYWESDFRNGVGWGEECVNWLDKLSQRYDGTYFEPMPEGFEVIAWQRIELFKEE